MNEKRITNKTFSKGILFLDLCKKANVKPSIRQASKFGSEKGIAFKVATKKGKPLTSSQPGYWSGV